MIISRLCRLVNRVYRGGVGRKTIAKLGRSGLRPGARVARARVGNGFLMDLSLDHYIDSAIYFQAFEYSTGRAMAQILRPGDTMVDGGANIGFFALMACRIVGPSGRVVAFEPNAETRRRLAGNVALNEWNARVQMHPCGLSDETGSAQLYIPSVGGDGAGLASLRRQDEWQGGAGNGYETQTITVERLDRLWARHESLRLIKLDVEGAELQALRGSEAVIRSQRPHVICEHNPNTARTFGYDVDDLISFFLETIGGYSIRALASRGIVSDVRPDEPAVKRLNVENWWFVP